MSSDENGAVTSRSAFFPVLSHEPRRQPLFARRGTPPAVLAGRADILAAARDAIASLVLGQAPRPMLVTGHRGMGKTVLLNAFAR